MSRSINTVKNSVYGVCVQFINYIFNFICRTVFISVLGSTYLGVSGLFQNILSVLSLAELGIGSAMTYNLYKPLAERDEKKISEYMNFYAKAYTIIGFVVTGVGLSLLPVLKFIIKDIDSVPDIYLIYILYILNSGISYFFSYKCTLFEADQKNYIVLTIRSICNIVTHMVQIIFLVVFRNYIVYFAIGIVFSLLGNLAISILGDKKYSFLKKHKNSSLSTEEKKLLAKHVGAMTSHRVGGVVVNSTDNLIISTVLGLSTVGYYSNYHAIISIVKSVLNPILSSFTAGVGNLNASEGVDKSYDIFKSLYLFEYWLQGFVTVCFFVLFQPFIKLWIGAEYLISSSALIIIIANYYFTAMRHPVIIYNTSLGLFWNDRYKPWVEAAVNLGASLVLVKYMGLVGVFAGTLISTILVCWWVEPYILYKNHFKKNVLNYYLKTLIDFVCLLLCALVVQWICAFFAHFVLKMIVCVVLVNLYFLIRFYRTAEFKYIFDRVKNIIARIIKRKVK